ncbi:TPA: capsid assembly protein [Photobacterium damselae]
MTISSNNETHSTVTMSTDTSVDEQSYVDETLKEVADHEAALEAIDKPDSELFTQEPEVPEAPVQEEQQHQDHQEEESSDTFSFDKFGEEIAETGELSEESLAELEKHGFSRQYMEQYVSGIEAQRELAEARAFASVGGEDNYREMMEWAGANLPEESIDKFNDAVLDENLRDRAIKELADFYRSEVGTGGDLLMGDRPAKTSSNVYTSFEQLVADQSDPRYDADPAYRAMVMKKLSRSNI